MVDAQPIAAVGAVNEPRADNSSDGTDALASSSLAPGTERRRDALKAQGIDEPCDRCGSTWGEPLVYPGGVCLQCAWMEGESDRLHRRVSKATKPLLESLSALVRQLESIGGYTTHEQQAELRQAKQVLSHGGVPEEMQRAHGEWESKR